MVAFNAKRQNKKMPMQSCRLWRVIILEQFDWDSRIRSSMRKPGSVACGVSMVMVPSSFSTRSGRCGCGERTWEHFVDRRVITERRKTV
ncbi:hypothetical protein Zmor_024176 [Zophobas morio]|uniref:Uncharacterized protein n=1 Tax=Zophobas morio TaxID=2755281 RepID=A0AA38M786_9CUCU|nr:hypothetical protein Zmor_024176 [Zophobas morio]